MVSEDNLKCFRCSTELQSVGTHKFHTGGNKNALILLEGLGHFGTKFISFDLYVCPQCGHTEMFLSHVGKEHRPQATGSK